MLKSTNDKNKCARIEYAFQYNVLKEGLNNPYCYNFGRIVRDGCKDEFVKMQQIVNGDYFYKR